MLARLAHERLRSRDAVPRGRRLQRGVVEAERARERGVGDQADATRRAEGLDLVLSQKGVQLNLRGRAAPLSVSRRPRLSPAGEGASLAAGTTLVRGESISCCRWATPKLLTPMLCASPSRCASSSASQYSIRCSGLTGQ